MFSKSDLKVGYVVETRSGLQYITVNTEGGLSFTRDGGWQGIDNYNNDLTEKKGTAGWDIVKVYGLTLTGYRALNITTDSRPLLWVRKEEPKLTELSLQQIADKFNIPVETLRVKE